MDPYKTVPAGELRGGAAWVGHWPATGGVPFEAALLLCNLDLWGGLRLHMLLLYAGEARHAHGGAQHLPGA